MQVTIEEKDLQKARRLLATDDVFSLLWELDQKMREYQKYGYGEKTIDDILDELRDMIHEENLLDLYM